MKPFLFTLRLVTVVFFLLFYFSTSVHAQLSYVKINASGSGDGNSWNNAYNDVQSAIDAANPGDTICVAAGTYFPTHKHLGNSTRNSTFYINKTIVLYGGFSGEAGSEGNFSQRNTTSHETILSGDLGITGITSDNAFHVVFLDHVSEAMRIDGFTITNGNNVDGVGLELYGAGIYNDAFAGISSPTIANCLIRQNTAIEFGGGMVNFAQEHGEARPLLINCVFESNRASSGGGIGNYVDNGGISSPTFMNCIFKGNSAPTGQGGAMSFVAHSSTASPRIINSVFTGNHSPTSSAINCFTTGTGVLCPELYNCAMSGNTGGSVRVSDLATQSSRIVVRNSILWNNPVSSGLSTNAVDPEVAFSIIQFGFSGEGNLSDDPLFVASPPVDSFNLLGDLHLQEGSPAIDAGRNSDVPDGVTTDLDNNPRMINPVTSQAGIVDMGPYEVQSITTAVSNIISDSDWKVYPNPAHDQFEIALPAQVNGILHLMDSKGIIISTNYFKEGQLDSNMNVSGLAPGTYYVQLLIGRLQDVKKITVQ
jgi:hypothetical protein